MAKSKTSQTRLTLARRLRSRGLPLKTPEPTWGFPSRSVAAEAAPEPRTIPEPTKAQVLAVAESKEAFAVRVATEHAESEPSIRTFRLMSDREDADDEPVKLLEVNKHAIEEGIVPIRFWANLKQDRPYTLVIVEVSPDELERIKRGVLVFPYDWWLGAEFSIPSSTIRP